MSLPLTYRTIKLHGHQIRSFHCSHVRRDQGIQQLIASAQSTARLLRSASENTSNHASPSSQSIKQQATVSLKRQASNELSHDMIMARSLKAQLSRTKAPSLPIAPGVRYDLPSDTERARRWRRRRSPSNPGSGHHLSADSPAAITMPVEVAPAKLSRRKQRRMHAKKLASAKMPTDGEAEYQNIDNNTGTISARTVQIKKVKPLRRMKIARLRRNLGRVLFSPGVHPLRDVRTGVWNFDPALHDIPKPNEFAFERCPQYITPSQDAELLQLAQRHRCRFLGSTSTLTKALSQIYFAISGGKGVDLATLSQEFASERTTFTPGAELPASLIVNKIGDDYYSVDSDKRLDVDNVISDFGRILEKMLTAENRDFQRFLRSSPDDAVPEEERTAKEAYQYQRSGSLIMRSQLDCYDPRLPGSGVFDIKTRACLPVRYDRANYLANSAYDIWKDRGYTESFEREYYDLLRAGMLKFSLQVRIGGMDGIFLAYHNTSRIYGFQYIPLSEIDQRLFGSTELADQAFKLSVSILEKLLQRCVEAFPGESVAVTMKRTPAATEHSFTAYVEPQQWDESSGGKRPIRAITFTLRNFLDKEAVQGPVMLAVDEKIRKAQDWSVEYSISQTGAEEDEQAKARTGKQRLHRELVAMNSLYVPEGQSVRSMTTRDAEARNRNNAPSEASPDTLSSSLEARNAKTDPLATIRWKKPGVRQLQLRREARDSGRAYERRKKSWRKGKIMSVA